MRKLALVAAALLAACAAATPFAASAAFAATGPKVVIIVGPTEGVTSTYRADADQAYAEARKWTSNVVKVYSPNATWAAVKAAVVGASVVVYLGHGNGWPSPYTYDPNYTTKDGFGLNAAAGQGDSNHKYYGEPYIRTLDLAPNALVILYHLCYASGNSEPGNADPTVTVAKQRVDNYASAFLAAGASAVIADGHTGEHWYYLRALFTSHQSLDQLWRGAPDFHNHVSVYSSSRTSGATFAMDPESVGHYYRSIAGRVNRTTDQVLGTVATDVTPTTFTVPGAASVLADGAPVYPDVASATAGSGATATLAAATKVRLDSRDGTAGDGSPVLHVHTLDGATQGWMTGTSLKPQDSVAPALWSTNDGTGAFSPNGDGSGDTFRLALGLSETATWTVTFRDSGGATLATATGSGKDLVATWNGIVDGNAVADGTYSWRLSATDGWGNGPLVRTGTLRVDTVPPTLTAAGALAASSAPTFSPNGDGVRDTQAFAFSTNEAGWIELTAAAKGGPIARHRTAATSPGSGSVTWDGKDDAGVVVPDGHYDVALRARDLAGNRSDASVAATDVYASLSRVASSYAVFYPQDGDAYGRSTTFSYRLARAATVTTTIVNASGSVVRTVAVDRAEAAAMHSFSWDGRNAAGAFVPVGTYRFRVAATDGSVGTSQTASVTADSFRLTVSDATPGRGQTITITAVAGEHLTSNPSLFVWQPGLTRYSVSMSHVAYRTYRVTFRLRASGQAGTLKLLVRGYDDHGARTAKSVYLPLH